MRSSFAIFLTGSLAVVGCAGDSSSMMSVWNDSGAANGPGTGVKPLLSGGAGGAGGQGLGGQMIAQGGSGGGGITFYLGGSGGQSSGGSGGTIRVAGGTRDLTTTQCISTSGGTCPVSTSYLACLEGNCGASITDCYYSDGISSAAGGKCQSYANCMLACPCDAGRSKCEDACQQSYVLAVPDCSTCVGNLYICANRYNCPAMTLCTSSSGGASGGVPGGYGGSGGYRGNGGATGGTGVTIGLDAGPVVPPVTPDAAPYKGDAHVSADVGPIGVTADVSPLRTEIGLPVFVLDASPLPVDLGTRIRSDGAFRE